MRRLLDALQKAPLPTANYALLQVPSWEPPDPDEVDNIHRQAQRYLDRFARSEGAGLKGGNRRLEITEIIQQVEGLALEQQTEVLEGLGVHPVWYEDHAEVPGILARIVAQPASGG